MDAPDDTLVTLTEAARIIGCGETTAQRVRDQLPAWAKRFLNGKCYDLYRLGDVRAAVAKRLAEAPSKRKGYAAFNPRMRRAKGER